MLFVVVILAVFIEFTHILQGYFTATETVEGIGMKLAHINSSPPSDVCMRQWIGAALVKIMASHIFGAKPLSESMLGYCQLDP